MRTRGGIRYPRLVAEDDDNNKELLLLHPFSDMKKNRDDVTFSRLVKRPRYGACRCPLSALPGDSLAVVPRSRKRVKKSPETPSSAHCNPFDALPDDLVITILSKLSASASRPSDFVNVLVT